jgi:putative FmdB family regulatory protein
MPMYEYECAACGHRFERIQKFSDPPVDECPSCGEPKVQKLLSSPAIQFKGSGWYITDYAKKGSVGDAKETGKSSESKESGKESKESRESKESKESRESKESKESTKSTESKSTTPASGTTSSPKASGE